MNRLRDSHLPYIDHIFKEATIRSDQLDLILIHIGMAEEGRLELPRRITSTYRFSKPAPSPTWVLLRIDMRSICINLGYHPEGFRFTYNQKGMLSFPLNLRVWARLCSSPELFTGCFCLSINNHEMTLLSQPYGICPPTIVVPS